MVSRPGPDSPALESVVEVQSGVGQGLQARIDAVGELDGALVLEFPGFGHQLLVDLEMRG